jgi:hypothetical protein
MSEYKPITKADISMPEYCIFFIRKIIEDIEKKNLDPGDMTYVKVDTYAEEHPYVYDAVELVCKTFGRKGYDVMIPTFRREEPDKNGRTLVHYSWKVTKRVNLDDLPF